MTPPTAGLRNWLLSQLRSRSSQQRAARARVATGRASMAGEWPSGERWRDGECALLLSASSADTEKRSPSKSSSFGIPRDETANTACRDRSVAAGRGLSTSYIRPYQPDERVTSEKASADFCDAAPRGSGVAARVQFHARRPGATDAAHTVQRGLTPTMRARPSTPSHTLPLPMLLRTCGAQAAAVATVRSNVRSGSRCPTASLRASGSPKPS